MNYLVIKETRLNIRVRPSFKDDLAAIAEYHGLTVSSWVHSVLVKAIRREKEMEPEAFITPKHEHDVNEKRKLAPVVARIEPAEGMTKDEIRRTMVGNLKLGDQEKRKKTG